MRNSFILIVAMGAVLSVNILVLTSCGESETKTQNKEMDMVQKKDGSNHEVGRWDIPLNRALTLNEVKKLVEAGADINQQDIGGATPMIVAATLNQYQIVNYLIEAGADPKLKNKMGISIIYIIKDSHETMAREGEGRNQMLKTVELLKERGIAIDLSEPFDRKKRE